MSGDVRMGVVGAGGRMGTRLVALGAATAGLDVVAQATRSAPLTSISPGDVDVIIDFSSRSQAPETARWCADHGVGLVLGTTGLSDAEQATVTEAAGRVAVVAAPNFSVGVNAVFALAGELAALVGSGWNLEVVEAHHKDKVDAPSGTARRLVDVLRAARSDLAESTVTSGRDGIVGPRPADEIGVHALRGGDVVGDHTVLYLGDGEQIHLHHHAQSRDIFAQGALRAARWLGVTGSRPPGLYDMADVLRDGG